MRDETFLTLMKATGAIELIVSVVPTLQKPYADYKAKKLSSDDMAEKVQEAIANGEFYKLLPKSKLNDGSEIFKLIVRMVDPNPLDGHRPSMKEISDRLKVIYPEGA